jgi:hypothetical protein
VPANRFAVLSSDPFVTDVAVVEFLTHSTGEEAAVLAAPSVRTMAIRDIYETGFDEDTHTQAQTSVPSAAATSTQT